jgi:hypothetical protein
VVLSLWGGDREYLFLDRLRSCIQRTEGTADRKWPTSRRACKKALNVSQSLLDLNIEAGMLSKSSRCCLIHSLSASNDLKRSSISSNTDFWDLCMLTVEGYGSVRVGI